MHPLHTTPCDDTLGNPSTLPVMLAEDKAGNMPGVPPNLLILARHNGLLKATSDFKKAIRKFTTQGPMVKRTARPIFITRAMLEQLVYEHDGTHGLQFYWGFVPQLGGVDMAWDWLSNKKPWPTLDFRLLIVPTKNGAAFVSHENPTPEQQACHITLTPSKVYAPKTNKPNAPYVWQDATLGDRQDLKASQVHMWPFDPDGNHTRSYFIGRYRLYNDVLQHHKMIRIEPIVTTTVDGQQATTQVGLVMAGVDRETDPWPKQNAFPDAPGDGTKPTVFWTKYIDVNNGAYCTLPCRPHCPGSELE